MGHRRGGLAHHAEGAGEEDVDRPGEDVGRVRGAVLADHPAPRPPDRRGRRRPCAAGPLGRGGDRLVHRLLLRGVGGDVPARRVRPPGPCPCPRRGRPPPPSRRLPRRRVVASPRPPAPPVTSADDPERSTIPPWVTRSGGVPSGGGGSMPRLETAGFDSPKVLYCCDNSIDYCFASAIRAPQTRGHHPRRGARVRSSHRQRSAHGHRHRPQGHPCQPTADEPSPRGRSSRAVVPMGARTPTVRRHPCSRRVQYGGGDLRATPRS